MAEKETKVVETEEKKDVKAAKKEKKDKKKGKVKHAWKGFKSETKKIVWPTWKQVLKNSLMVVAIVLAFAILFGLLDYFFNWGFQSLVELLVDAFQK